jgi:CheY-like chemotaxis protein
LTGETILIVEDDGLIALYLTELLERVGYRVAGAVSSGETVLRILEKASPPNLILMDIGLDGSLDGIETARQVQERFSIPLIFVTAYTSEITLERIHNITSHGFIGKPFMDHDILALVREVLDSRSA